MPFSIPSAHGQNIADAQLHQMPGPASTVHDKFVDLALVCCFSSLVFCVNFLGCIQNFFHHVSSGFFGATTDDSGEHTALSACLESEISTSVIQKGEKSDTAQEQETSQFPNNSLICFRFNKFLVADRHDAHIWMQNCQFICELIICSQFDRSAQEQIGIMCCPCRSAHVS